MSALANLLDRLFRVLHRRTLIYNACWEDPAVDRDALVLGPEDRVLVVASGGCNALDYLLAGAGEVNAVDINACQTALLEFKVAAIRGLDYSAFWDLFGAGRSPRARALYINGVRPRLSARARRYWDRRIGWFAGRGWRKSFYYHGGWGSMMWLAMAYWKTWRGLRKPIEALFRTNSLGEQREIYRGRLRDRLWTPSVRWAMSRRFPLALMGIPERQRIFILGRPGGLGRWGREVLEDWMSKIPFPSNYFLRVYTLGSFAPGCRPEYLTPGGFARLKEGLLDRLTVHTASVTDYLRRTRPGISKFVLLDHMDWMASEELAAEWEALLEKARPGARVIFRSALADVDYLDRLRVQHRGQEATLGRLLRYDRERAAALHARDRVHMYGSFHIATLADDEG